VFPAPALDPNEIPGSSLGCFSEFSIIPGDLCEHLLFRDTDMIGDSEFTREHLSDTDTDAEEEECLRNFLFGLMRACWHLAARSFAL
jgi:hypothetical protein